MIFPEPEPSSFTRVANSSRRKNLYETNSNEEPDFLEMQSKKKRRIREKWNDLISSFQWPTPSPWFSHCCWQDIFQFCSSNTIIAPWVAFVVLNLPKPASSYVSPLCGQEEGVKKTFPPWEPFRWFAFVWLPSNVLLHFESLRLRRSFLSSVSRLVPYRRMFNTGWGTRLPFSLLVPSSLLPRQ